MATFAYVEIPADAIRLKPSTLAPAAKILTALPDASPPPRPPSELLAPALALVPQILLSPTPTASAIASAIATPHPRGQAHALLSTRDPLSVPIITANFRRFVSKVGPVFWLQDRIEEIVLWKKGWKRTTVWLAAYGFVCYFPRMALLIPHMALLGIMLFYSGAPPARQGTADWQANIQAIQNLMGAFSDAHDAVVPLLPLLLPPQSSPTSPLKSHANIAEPLPKPSQRTSDVPSITAPPPHHPLLIVTLVSFLFLIPTLMSNLVPLRLLFFLAGAGSVTALHPRFRHSLSSVVFTALSGSGPGLSFQLSITLPRLPRPPSLLSLLPIVLHPIRRPPTPPQSPPRTHTFACTLCPRDVYLFFRRLVDDDKLDDTVWRAPLAHVELWENERWVQTIPEAKRRKPVVMSVREGRESVEEGQEEDWGSTTPTATGGDGGKGTGGTWSKANLKPNERVGWTKARDGWSGVGGEVSSNLTFSLSPGWAFVETEGWRPDLRASWAVEGVTPSTSVCVGADEGDGWTYTTDTWTHPRPDGRPGDGWVTRRRRWVRRVYLGGGAR